MRDRARDDLIHQLAEDVALLLGGTAHATTLRKLAGGTTTLATSAARKLVEYAPGWPTGGGIAVSGTTDPDKIGNQIADRIDNGRALPYPETLDRHLVAAAHQLAIAVRIATTAVVPINAPATKTRDPADLWCESCARGKDRQGRPIAQAVQIVNGSPRRTPDGTTGGARAEATLCGWCYGFTSGEKAWPPVPLVERRHAGYRIFETDIDKAMGRTV